MPAKPSSDGHPSTPLTSTITIQAGTYQGTDHNPYGITAFLGIPYAAAPIDGKPLTLPPPSPHPLESEDSLRLNIWTGAAHPSERRPVMVWVHGGGFQFGSSAEPTYHGENLASRGVVCVTFNYRLEALGFLALPQLDVEGPSPSGNFGLQDQIAAFGGDPDNVTVFGESAGAHAIGLLLASPLLVEEEKLVHKAIL